MVAVLKARFLAEGSTPCDSANADRGSECDDCMELDSDTEPVTDNEDCTELNILDDDFGLGPSIRM